MRRMRSGCCARAVSGHAAAPPRSVMNSRRFTTRCLRASNRKDSTPHLRQEPAALRDFDRAYDRGGSKCENLAMSICWPVYPR